MGAGLAAARTIAQLRQSGYPGSIVLAGTEPLPYDRPALTKAVLTGQRSDTALWGSTPPRWTCR